MDSLTKFVGEYYEVTSTEITKHYSVGGQRVAVRENGTLTFLLGEHLGGTSAVINTTGQKVAENWYMPFGETRYSSGTLPTGYTFTGQFDNTTDFGWMYYKARWYDPTLGRFGQPDSVVPGAGDPRAWDRFSYVKNNPVVYNDPSGHKPCNEMANGRCVAEPGWNKNEDDNLSTRAIQQKEPDPIDYLLPTNIGLRLQVELSGDIGIGLSGTIGVNFIYNRVSDKAAGNIDWALEPGLGIGGGISATGGLVLGWASSSVKDVTEGYSAILSGTAAAEAAISVAVTAPVDENGLHVDPLFNQVPATIFIGAGAGGAYGSAGLGVNGPTGLISDLTSYLPWK